MRFWRISEFADLSGFGGTVANGRWSTKGPPIIYAAETSALALLEVLVRARLSKAPSDYQLLRIEADDSVEQSAFPATIPPVPNESVAWGDAWLAARKTALARVPSALAPFTFNILINPRHPDIGRIRIADTSRWPWDRRLFR